MGFVQYIKNQDRGLYWQCVDMAARGETAEYIRGYVVGYVQNRPSSRLDIGDFSRSLVGTVFGADDYYRGIADAS